MASTQPIAPEPMLEGTRRGSQSHQSHSRRSSTSGRSSKTGTSSALDASEGAKASTRGRKPFEISEEVDRGLVRVLNSTDVSLDKVAQAVEDSGGPRKLWLRRRLEKITDTKSFGVLRLRNQRDAAQERRRRQQKAMGLPVPESTEAVDLERHETSTRPSSSVPSSRTSGIPSQGPDSMEQESNLQNVPSTQDESASEITKRSDSHTASSRRRGVDSDHRRQSAVRISAGPPPSIGRSLTNPTPAKRPFTEDADDVLEDNYGARKDRTRALSLSAIISRLEDLTGQTGLYEHIKRISVKSHISPHFRTFRFSRGSRRGSEGSTVATNSMYEQRSPNGSEAAPIPYDPDPDYETFYHDPTSGRLARLQSDGAVAVVALLEAKAASMSDEEAESHLLQAMPKQNSADHIPVSVCDDTGVTALHLAVAYGYPRVCRHLLRNRANPFAVTNRGSSVCRFARPAQDFAKDTSLYHRILNCRQWICAGLPPPLATELDKQNLSDAGASKTARPKQKRVKTNDTASTLFTVEETPIEEAADNTAQMPPRSSTVSERFSGLTPLITGFEFGMNPSIPSYSADRSASIYDDSPVAISRRSCLRDHGTILDLLTPNSISPNVVFWPPDAIAPATLPTQASSSLQPSSQAVETSSQQYDTVGGLNIYNGNLTSSAPFLNYQYEDTGQVASTSNSVPEITTSFHWPNTDLQHSQQLYADLPYLANDYTVPNGFLDVRNATFDYQNSFQHGVSQRHYPTPPTDPMRQQESWERNWDVPRATAMALAEASADFQSTLWPDGARDNDHSHGYYYSHEPHTYDPNDSTHF